MTRKWKYDRELTAAMVDDFLMDPILAAKVLLNIKLPPHQEIRLMQMWVKAMFVDDSGFSTGKSFSIALACALRSCLMTERESLIISGTFRQGKLVFKYFDKWKDSSSLFRSCLSRAGGRYRITHSQDAWECNWKGGSSARALPPGFLQDSERMRSERANDGYFDEWNTFPKTILTKTLFGRITKINKYANCPVRQNHKALLSTPSDVEDPIYEIVESLDKAIDEGSKSDAHFSCNYRHMPRQRIWMGMVDYAAIGHMQRTNPKSIIESEVNGNWRRSTLNYYNKTKIDLCRVPSIDLLIRKNPSKDFVSFGFDSARGGGKHTSKKGEADDFSLSCTTSNKDSDISRHSFSITRNHITAGQSAWIIRKMYEQLKPDIIAYDPMGGGMFVADELEKSVILDPEGRVIEVQPIVDIDDHSTPNAIKILVPFSRGHSKLKLLYKSCKSESVAINKLHRRMLALIEKRKFALCPEWEGWDIYLTKKTASSMRKFLASNNSFRGPERIHAEMDLVVNQLMLVDVKRDKKTGLPLQDSYQMYSFGSKDKKDGAYGLLYSQFGLDVLRKMRNRIGSKDKSTSSTIEIGVL